MYVEVFQTTSRDISTSEALTNAFVEEGIRYHIVYKGPPNQPYIGMSGEQFVSLEVHAEDLARARQVVSEVLEHVYRNR